MSSNFSNTWNCACAYIMKHNNVSQTEGGTQMQPKKLVVHGGKVWEPLAYTIKAAYYDIDACSGYYDIPSQHNKLLSSTTATTARVLDCLSWLAFWLLRGFVIRLKRDINFSETTETGRYRYGGTQIKANNYVIQITVHSNIDTEFWQNSLRVACRQCRLSLQYSTTKIKTFKHKREHANANDKNSNFPSLQFTNVRPHTTFTFIQIYFIYKILWGLNNDLKTCKNNKDVTLA